MPRRLPILRLLSWAGTTAGVGVLITLAVTLTNQAGGLARLERFLYDERVKHCQSYLPPPTDRLVHLDIDDTALQDVHRWPWDRALLAEVLEELALAQPKVVAMDVLLTEAQPDQWLKNADGTFQLVREDPALADALTHLGDTLIPASFPLDAIEVDPLTAAVRDVLVEDVELDEPAIRAKLTASSPSLKSRPGEIDAVFLNAKRDAMFRRVKAELQGGMTDEAAIRRRVLPRTSDAGLQGPITRLFAAQHRRALAAIEVQKRARPYLPGVMPPMPEVALADAPIAPLESRSTTTGFVNYPPSRDNRIRSVPLFIKSDGYLYPQLGLSLACAMMDVPLDKVKLSASAVTIPVPGRPPIVIPTRTLSSRNIQGTGEGFPVAIDLPWFGPSDWRAMYSAPGAAIGGQHVLIVSVWDACATRDRIFQQNQDIDRAIKSIYQIADKEKMEALERKPLPADDWQGRVALARLTLAEQTSFVEESAVQIKDHSPVSPSDEDRIEAKKTAVAVAAIKSLPRIISQAPELAAQLDRQRQDLHGKLHGKGIIIGWTASSSIADFVATPLHDRCPGPVVHGVVFNAIMTGEFWRVAPPWSAIAVTLAAGLFTTLVVAVFSPPVALLLSGFLALTYTFINGTLLFDYGNLIVDLGGPLTAIAAVWAGGTLTQLVREQRYRALIRRRFRTYVDPQLVDYVERHPKQAGFEGERREMTVVFTDLVGFTSLTEVMGEKTVTLLNELWGRVVPVVRRSGYLNKFLGDGLMFFYGAPAPNDQHARDTVDTVLELETVMRLFREEVTEPRGLPPLAMRIGVSTGHMIVGDAGAGEAGSDYTVLGDVVNLGARLEGANKAFGTRNLMTARTTELAGDAFLFRPIASLYVVGKEIAVDTHEAVCRRDAATAAQIETIRLTERLVRHYRQQELEECVAAAAALDEHAGPTKLTALYRELALQFLQSTDDAKFNPAITLTSK